MPNVVSKEKKEEQEPTDRKVANRWMVEGKNKIPHEVRTQKARELQLWGKLIEKSKKEGQEGKKEDK